jgi:tetratricopeptide (TPR) repeat protein
MSFRNWEELLKMETFYDAHETEQAAAAAAANATTSTAKEPLSSGGDTGASDEVIGSSVEASKNDGGESTATVEKNIDLALEAKEKGNSFFRTKDYDNAVDEYSRAIDLCPETEEHKEVLSVLYGNRAACYFADDEYDLTVEDCTKSINLNPNYVKVLLRRSQSYEKLDQLENAIQGKIGRSSSYKVG